MLKFKKPSYIKVAAEDMKIEKEKKAKGTEPRVPEGLWIKCPKCGELLYKEEAERACNLRYYKCPICIHKTEIINNQIVRNGVKCGGEHKGSNYNGEYQIFARQIKLYKTVCTDRRNENC